MVKLQRNPRDSGFDYMPAAISTSDIGSGGIYIKHKAWEDKPISIKVITTSCYYIECPDRDLVLSTESLYATPFAPVGFHEYVNLSYHHSAATADMNQNIVMVNYVDSLGARGLTDVRRGNHVPPGSTQILADSGGFQLGMGRIDFIDPIEEITWYNNNVDLAMVLDIPTKQHTDLLLRAARVQKANNDLMLKHKKDSLELINVFHGNTPDMVKQFREIVEDERIDRLAIAGAMNQDLFSCIDRVISVMLDTKNYKQHHVLGVTRRPLIMLLIYLQKQGFAKHITIDSSSHLQQALNRGYFYVNNVELGMTQNKLTRVDNIRNYATVLPCNCPVCSTIKYADVLREFDGGVITACMIASHNIWVMNNWITSMKEIIYREDKAKIKELVQSQFGSRGAATVKLICAIFDFIDTVKDEGLAKARVKFSYYLKKQTKLFNQMSIVADDDDELSEDEISSAEYRKHLETAIAKFEEYHGLTKGK